MSSPFQPRTPEQQAKDLELQALIQKSVALVEAMSPEEKAAMHEAQRESWIRGMMPLGYEESLEWCEAELVKVEEKIESATSWGAYLSVLYEDAQDLRRMILQKRAVQASK